MNTIHLASSDITLQLDVSDWMRSTGRFDGIRGTDRDWIAATCVFHDDRTPSFAVNADTGNYVCSACGAHGTFISLVKHVENHATAYDAELSLIARFGSYVPATNEPLSLDFGDVEEETFVTISVIFTGESEYLAERGISPDTQKTFGAGAHSVGIVVMPWHTKDGDVVTIKVRSTTTKAFWYDPPITPGRLRRLLYGLHLAREASILAVVEAEICTMSVAQAGFSCVGLGKSDVSPYQIDILRNHPCEEVVIWVDNPLIDTLVMVGGKMVRASAKAHTKLVDGLFGHKRVSVVDYTMFADSKDPNDVLRKHGEPAIRTMIECRIPIGLPLSFGE